MVADQHRLADRPLRAQRAGAVGQHDGAAAGGGGDAHAVGDDGGVVALVEVDPAEEDEHVLSGELDRAHAGAVADGRRRREPGQLGDRDLGAGAERVGAPPPSRAEHDGDVVAGDARAVGERLGSGGGEGVRIGGGSRGGSYDPA